MSVASPNIIDNISLRPPKMIRKLKPTFRTNVEREKYWDGEVKKWIEGDPKSGLTGPHYFHIQEFVCKDGSGRPIRPWWREPDDLVYGTYAEAFRIQWDAFFVKRREFGLSTIFGGSLPLCTALSYPGSTCVMTSADKDRLKDLFSQKLLFGYDNLDPDIKSPKAKTRQEGYLFLAQEEGEKKGEKKWTGLQSQIVGKETVKNPTTLEAYRAKYGFLDELFLHPKALKVQASTARCFMEGFDKIGTMVIGGTCGIGDTDGIKGGKKIYEDSQKMRILTCFLKGTWGISKAPEFDKHGMPTGKMLNFCPNGWNDEAGAYEWIMRRRDELYKAADKTLYYKFIADYPLSIEEVLNLIPDAVLPQQILFMLDEAEKAIARDNVIQQPYDLIRKPDNTVQAVPSTVEVSKAKFIIIELPKDGVDYGSATDPIPFGNASVGDGSDYCINIKNLQSNRHVAYYAERNMDSEECVKNAIMLQDLYGGPKTLLELTRGETAMKEYMNMIRTELLDDMPTFLGIKFEARKYPWGVSKNGPMEARGNKYLIQWLYANAHNIRLKRLIDECRWFTKINHDLLDSVIIECIQYENWKEKNKRKTKQFQDIPVYEMHRDANGVVRRREVKKNLVVNTVDDMMRRNMPNYFETRRRK